MMDNFKFEAAQLKHNIFQWSLCTLLYSPLVSFYTQTVLQQLQVHGNSGHEIFWRVLEATELPCADAGCAAFRFLCPGALWTSASCSDCIQKTIATVSGVHSNISDVIPTKKQPSPSALITRKRNPPVVCSCSSPMQHFGGFCAALQQ